MLSPEAPAKRLATPAANSFRAPFVFPIPPTVNVIRRPPVSQQLQESQRGTMS